MPHIDLLRRILHRKTVLLHLPRRNSRSRTVLLQWLQKDRIRRDLTIIPNLKSTEDLRSGSDQDIISDRRMALSLLGTDAAQRLTRLDRTIIPDNRSLPDHDPASMIDQDPMS